MELIKSDTTRIRITRLFPNGPIYDSPYHLMEHWDRVVAPICQITFMDSNP